MTILNTTFFAEEQLAGELSCWLCDVYAKAIADAGIFDGPAETARVVEPAEPGTVSFACRARCGSVEAARRWHGTTAALLRDDLHTRWGERVVWFTTYMEEI